MASVVLFGVKIHIILHKTHIMYILLCDIHTIVLLCEARNMHIIVHDTHIVSWK